jgi:serine/threonine protein kinase
MLSDLKHQNVLTPIGICIEENGYPMIIMLLMANGDLLSYLRNDQILLTVKQLLEFAQQIAEGIKNSSLFSNVTITFFLDP